MDSGVKALVYQRTRLDNGIRIVTESIPHVRSVAIGFWYLAGSRHESPSQNGISHLIEHLMFKGTKKRTARQIAEIIDASGGQMNAFTSKEATCYYARVLDEHVGLAVEILSDMLRNSVFAPAEMDKEKGVVLEEIKMYEDSPDEMVHDLFAEAVLAGHPLGQGILGSERTVRPIDRGHVLDYLEQRYVASNLVVAAAGNLVHAQVVEEVERWFGDLPTGRHGYEYVPLVLSGRDMTRSKDTEQVHICVGTPGLARNHPDRYALHVLDIALGGGMSSRFFQDLREERGLVYSTYTYHTSFEETGLFAVYAGASPDNAEQVLELLHAGLAGAARKGFGADELLRAKEQLKGSLMLSLENTANRMSRIARCDLLGEELLTPDELIRKIDQVTLADLERVAQMLFSGRLYTVAIGPVDDSLACAAGASAQEENGV